MLTLAQIQAELTTALSPEEKMAIMLLIKGSPEYYQAVGRWPLLEGTIDAETTLPTVKTPALRAILKILGQLPSIVVESNGSDTEPGYFSTPSNWRSLAVEALNVLYDIPVILGSQSFVLVQRRIANIKLSDSSIIDADKIGRI